jgi:hypothetical protein
MTGFGKVDGAIEDAKTPRVSPMTNKPDTAAEIERLTQEIDALHAQVAHLKAGGHEVQKYTRMGKQILCNDIHFADGASESAAIIVVAALNSAFPPIRSNP